MWNLRSLALAFSLLVGLVGSSEAATCFAVGGSFTWDNSADAAHWSSSSGGSGSTCAATGGVPKNAADTATFDGSSGGGTVTNNVDLSITTIVSSAFTGTLDWATNNKNVTLSTQWTDAATGTHTVNMGNGTWTFALNNGTPLNLTASANLTLSANGSNVVYAAGSTATNGRTFASGGKTFSTVTINGTNGAGMTVTISGGPTIGTFVVSNGALVAFTAATTTTITNAIAWAGISSAPISITGTGGTAPTISVASGSTIAWGYIAHVTFSNAALTATNSFDGGGNNTNGGSITAPSSGGGGGGACIGC